MTNWLDAIRAAQLYHKVQTSKDYEAQRELAGKVKKFLEENDLKEEEIVQIANTGLKVWNKVRQMYGKKNVQP